MKPFDSLRFLSLGFMAVGLLALISVSGSIKTAQGVILKCQPVSSLACATCAGTNQAYQCRPAGLATGQVYGTCVQGTGGCLKPPELVEECGNYDFTCGQNPVSIPGGTACLNQIASVCSPGN
jgi:hypothetical protein